MSITYGPNNGFYEYGIYNDALLFGITSSHEFFNKYMYCLWWGIRSVSTVGQGLETSPSAEENIFSIFAAVLGLFLLTLLFGNIQTLLQSTSMRLEEWRVRRMDTEQYMRHRQLPRDLKERVRKYDKYKWVKTRGVDEEVILQGLSLDLRRDIKRHLCLDLIREVPLFDQMDEHMLDAICERLKPVLCTPNTRLVRESDSVSEMIFIIRGCLDSYTTNGGRTGFFNSCRLGPGDFCGEELLTWALSQQSPSQGPNLPSLTRTVQALTEVEAFALGSEYVRFVASRFRKLHSKKLKNSFRYLSHQWRAWAACFIQAAWFFVNGTKNVELGIEHRTRSVLSSRSELAILGSDSASQRTGRAMGIDFPSAVEKPVDPDFTLMDRDRV